MDPFIEAYLSTKPDNSTRRVAVAAAGHLLRFLVRVGAIASPDDPVPWNKLIELADDAGRTARGPVDRQLVEEWLADLRGQALRPATVRAYLSSLRGFLEHLVREGVLTSNPCRDGPYIRVDPPDTSPRLLDDGELASLLRYLANRHGPVADRDYALVTTLLCTGARPGELCRLRVGDLHWRRGTVVLRALGHGRSREVPVLPMLREALLAYLRHHPERTRAEPVFTRDGGRPFTPGSLHAHVQRLLRAAGIERHLVTRAFRHTSLDLLHHAGAKPEAIQALAGHADVRTQRHYLHGPLEPVPANITDLGVEVIRDQIRQAARGTEHPCKEETDLRR